MDSDAVASEENTSTSVAWRTRGTEGRLEVRRLSVNSSEAVAFLLKYLKML